MDTGQAPFRFGAFELHVCAGELRRNGRRVRLQEHSFRVLALLAARAGEVVTREELHNALWADGTVVDFDNGLNAAMGKLRQALVDSAEHPRYIETVPRKGYRFIGKVEAPPEVPRAADRQAEEVPAAGAQRAAWRVVLGAALAAILLMLMGGLGTTGARRPSPPLPGKRMLVVLPFVNLGSDLEQFFADGLTEEMTTQLASLEPNSLGVIARTSAMQYKNASKSVAQIGKELGVDYVLEGSVRRTSQRVRISAQLIRAGDQLHLWAGNYDRSLGDVLTLQSEIGRVVAAHISLALSPEMNARLAKARVANPRAYEACQRARHVLWREDRTATDLDKAASYFRQAIAADPQYAAAYSGLAETYAAIAEAGHGPLEENIREAKQYAARALALDADLAEAHSVLAFAATSHDRDWATARREFLRALELDPSYTRARTLYCVFLLAVGEPQEALAEIRRAQQLDPLALGVRSQVVRTLYLARSYDEAIAESLRELELRPKSRFTLEILAQAYEQVGRYQAAISALDQLETLSPGNPQSVAARGHLLAVLGRRAEARQVV
ncbi:MAG TPA: winged helix-turn-helix domain-containing protein, partial [Polyangia bacterium]